MRTNNKQSTDKDLSQNIKEDSRCTQVLLVDGHDIFREGLTLFINKEPDLSVCGWVIQAEETNEHIKKHNPDIVIVDISNIGMSGIEVIKSIRGEFRNIPILVLSMYEGSYLTSLLKTAGADCCLDSLKVPDKLISKIKSLVN